MYLTKSKVPINLMETMKNIKLVMSVIKFTILSEIWIKDEKIPCLKKVISPNDRSI